MQNKNGEKPTRKDWLLIIVAFLAVMLMLFFPLLAKADNAKHEALVLVCPRDNLADCTIATARVFFKVRVESTVPSGCLALAMAKAAEVADLFSEEEAPKIVCGR